MEQSRQLGAGAALSSARGSVPSQSGMNAAASTESVSLRSSGINPEAIVAAVLRGEPKAFGANHTEGLPDIPGWWGSPAETLARSKAGLEVAMAQLGLGPEVELQLKVQPPSGRVAVSGNFAGRQALEDLIQETRELREAIVAATSNATFERVVAIAQRAAAAAERDPANAGVYGSWNVQESAAVQRMTPFLRYGGGALSARLIHDTTTIGALDSLPRPQSL